MTEKIKVNLSYNCYNLLLKDMESFQFMKQNNTANKNLFFNTLIRHMVEQRQKEYENTRAKLVQLLSGKIQSEEIISELLAQIDDAVSAKNEDTSNRSHGYYISFRPSKKMEELYDKIEYENLGSSTISKYYRNIFNAYSKLPQDVREEIIFHQQKETILKAIRLKRKLKITLQNQILDFIPYALVKTEDEQYNYLIGCIRKAAGIRIFSLHLYKLKSMFISKEGYSLSEEEEHSFDKVLVRGPREINARTVKTVIELTDKGVSLFKKMYLNRPIPDDIQGNTYTFTCSADNLFIYFSRFGKEAIVREPLNLKNQLKKFYLSAYNHYER